MESAILAISFPEWRDVLHFSGSALGHIIAAMIILVGFVATFLPIVPGPLVILIGALVHRFWLGAENGISWIGMGLLGLLCLGSFVLDYVAAAMGAKYFGASKWGAWGAIIGCIVGLFFGVFGILLGPLIGAFAFEILFARQKISPATKSTWGSLVGTLGGVAAKGVIAVAMVVWIIIDISDKLL